MKYNYYKKLSKYKNKDLLLFESLEKLSLLMFDNRNLRITVKNEGSHDYTIFYGDLGFIIQNNNLLSDYRMFYCFNDLKDLFNCLYFIRYDYD